MVSNEEFEKLPDGIFRSGVCSDSSTGCNIDNTGKILKWIAVKYGETMEWAIFLGYPDDSEVKLFRSGIKTRDEGNIRRLVPCTEGVFANYNM